MIQLRPVVHVVGLLLVTLATAMLLPAMVDAATFNPDWQWFVTAAVATGFLGSLLVLVTRGGGPFELDFRQAFLLTTACWVVIPTFAALPFIGLGLGYTDAFFEAMSGITTTGSTVIVGLDAAPRGVLLWRALLQWVGGVGIIVMAIIFLPFLRVGGMQLFRAESSEKSDKIVPRAFNLVTWIVTIYVGLTAACAVAYMITGMVPFDAFSHAMTTLSTGGYSTHDASFAHFANPATQWAGTAFMLAGALPFIVYIRFLKGERRALWRDPQIRGLAGLLVLVSLAVGLWLAESQGRDLVESLRHAAFNVTSVVTTTGFASEDYGAWGAPTVGIFLMLTFIGGCAGSTSGAIKIYRFQVLWAVARAQLLRMASPNRVVLLRYAGRIIPADVPIAVLAFLAVFMGAIALVTVALAFMGLDIVTALSASASAITNVGPGLGPVVGPAGSFATLPDVAKWVLSAAMLLGRLEVFTVLLLLDPQFWQH